LKLQRQILVWKMKKDLGMFQQVLPFLNQQKANELLTDKKTNPWVQRCIP
uniref:Transposase n=1 Tax=Haemonchus placei TaxID=6290 RepID=A0A0N4X9T6_HAEPC